MTEKQTEILKLLDGMPEAVADRFLAELQGAAMALDALDAVRDAGGAA